MSFWLKLLLYALAVVMLAPVLGFLLMWIAEVWKKRLE